MRAIIDTNVLLAGLLWHGTPHALLERIRDGTLTLISSPALLANVADREGDIHEVFLEATSEPRELSVANQTTMSACARSRFY